MIAAQIVQHIAPANAVASSTAKAHRKPTVRATAMNTANSMNGSASSANSSDFATFIAVSILAVEVGGGVPIV
jgi:hypothetical protein